MKTLVQLSETIRDHLTKQRAKSTNYNGSCKYRNDSGQMCAVGCLITDEAYDEGLEGKVATDQDIIDALERSGVVMDEATIALARAWQSYHDASYTSSDVLSDVRYWYGCWIRTNAEEHSPATVHDIIMKDLTK